jgi:hypothetical protein
MPSIHKLNEWFLHTQIHYAILYGFYNFQLPDLLKNN